MAPRSLKSDGFMWFPSRGMRITIGSIQRIATGGLPQRMDLMYQCSNHSLFHLFQVSEKAHVHATQLDATTSKRPDFCDSIARFFGDAVGRVMALAIKIKIASNHAAITILVFNNYSSCLLVKRVIWYWILGDFNVYHFPYLCFSYGMLHP